MSRERFLSVGLPALLVVLMAVPLFFVNVFDSHDWGGDFAQYIAQTINISEGAPTTQIGYLYNPEHPFLAPPTYPVGYSILLLPVYWIAGNSILAFTLFTNVLIVFFGWIANRWFQKHFGIVIALLLTAVVLWHPWLLRFKMEIRSDVPFALCLLLFIWLYEKRNKNWIGFAFLLGLIGGFAMCIRSIGAVLFIAVSLQMAWELVQIQRKRSARTTKEVLLDQGVILFGMGFLYWLLNWMFLEVLTVENPYPDLFSSQGIFETIFANCDYYFGLFRYYFAPPNATWNIVPQVMSWLAFAFFVVGFVRELRNGISFMMLVFVGYLGVLFLFPYQASGLRFLLPVIPMLLFFMVKGMQWPAEIIGFQKKWIPFAVGGLLLATYIPGWQHQLRYQNRVVDGPQSKYAQECWQFIQTNTAEDDVFTFSKPRVLALYTGRKAVANNPKDAPEKLDNTFSNYKVVYFVYHTDVSDKAFLNWLDLNEHRLDVIFQNEKMKIFRKQP